MNITDMRSFYLQTNCSLAKTLVNCATLDPMIVTIASTVLFMLIRLVMIGSAMSPRYVDVSLFSVFEARKMLQ
jgi:hypothetical protein